MPFEDDSYGKGRAARAFVGRLPGVVAADALQFPTKAGSVEGIQHNLDCGEVEVAADGQVVTLAD